VGTLVCWDQWYPEGARLTALQGADLLCYPTAIGWHPSEKSQYGAAQADAWRTIQRAHAIANGVYVVAVNRVGHEPGPGDGIEFFGGSFVCDPFGVILAEAGREKPEILIVDVDPAHAETVRQHWPFLRDRRVDAYAPITARHLQKP
jgi:N-carbamoylputrescine amidase